MLVRLFSETNLLVKDVTFKPGLNIIYGKYSGTKEAKGINGIGKSSLVRLINYMFLGETAEKEFNKKKYDFLRKENHSLTLEFEVNGKRHFTRREFSSSKIMFYGKSLSKLEEYDKMELLQVLSGIFFPVLNNEIYIEGNRFRTIMQFFIKDDVQNKSRKDPTNFFSFPPSAVDRSIYNFYLLGLNTAGLINFKEVSKEYKQYKGALKTTEEKLKVDTGFSIEEYRSEKLKLETKVRILKERLNDYDFSGAHIELEGKLGAIISLINKKSTEYHSISQKLKNLNESYEQNQEIDTLKIQKIYNEVLLNFGNAIRKNLDEITEFKSELFENRNKFLISREKELKNKIDSIFKELSNLEGERTKLLNQLKEKGALDKLESTYEELIIEQSQVERQNQILIQVDEYNKILADQEVVLSEVKRDIFAEILNSENELNELRALFAEILVSALIIDKEKGGGYYGVSQQRRGKKTDLPFVVDIKVPKSGSLGQEDLKMISYDLMIFLNSIKKGRRIPDFLIHDGVFGNMSHKIMVNYLNYLNKKHLELGVEKNFQYIVTFSEDEIVIPELKKGLYGEFDFDFDKQIIIELEDDDRKMLFKRNITQ